MTIAIGLFCNGGVVLAADSQEGPGYPGGLKTRAQKIVCIGTPLGSVAISGAGPGGYLDGIAAQLSRSIEIDERINEIIVNGGVAPTVSIREMETKFATILNDFYTKHVLQPFERQDHHFSLVMAATTFSGQMGLWYSDQTVLIPCMHSRPVAVGAGSQYALQLMANHWPFLSIRQAITLAAYVIYRVKKNIESCGEYTDIVYLRPGTILPGAVNPWETKIIETQFERYIDLESDIADYALGRKSTDEKQLRDKLIAALDTIRNDIKKRVNMTEHYPLANTSHRLWDDSNDEPISEP